ncbi:unnamed protein product [Symbiodinium sp. CCMP2592]|nr:unnamed protein product [Symbiodinium sp. CCMP2592]
MGRGSKNQQPWVDGNGYRVWPGAYSPRQPPWRGEGHKGHTAKAAFPTYASVPIAKAKAAAPAESSTSTALVAAGSTTPTLQAALNHTRKAELRVCKLRDTHKAAGEQWDAFHAQMKEAFKTERQRFLKDQARLQEELAAAEAAQEAARTALRRAWTGEGAGAGAPGPPADDDMDTDELFAGWVVEEQSTADAVPMAQSVVTPVRAPTAAPRTPQPHFGHTAPGASPLAGVVMALCWWGAPGLSVAPATGPVVHVPEGLGAPPASGTVGHVQGADPGSFATTTGDHYGPSPPNRDKQKRRSALAPFGIPRDPPEPGHREQGSTTDTKGLVDDDPDEEWEDRAIGQGTASYPSDVAGGATGLPVGLSSPAANASVMRMWPRADAEEFPAYVVNARDGDSLVVIETCCTVAVSARVGDSQDEVIPPLVAESDECTITYETRRAHFAIFAPDCTPEIVDVELDFPSGEDEAGDIVSIVRGDEDATLFGTLIRVDPQPCEGFGCILALPAWAGSRVVILVDSRLVDGRIFSRVIDAWIQWGSFVLQVGLKSTDDLSVYIGRQPTTPGRPLTLQQGDLVTILPRAAPLPTLYDLQFKLNRARLWHASPPDFMLASRHSFLLLTDGLPRLAQIDRGRIRETDDFREAAAGALQCSADDLTCKVSRPRITNSMHLGIPCEVVMLATTALSRTPVPPGRPLPPQIVVFFDLRAILKGFSWCILPSCLPQLQDLEARFQDGVPDGFQVFLNGGVQENVRGIEHLRITSCCVLAVEYIPVPTDGASEDHESSEESSDDSSSDSSPGQGPAPGPDPAAEGARSRTPRNRITSQSGPRKLFRAHSVNPVVHFSAGLAADTCKGLEICPSRPFVTLRDADPNESSSADEEEVAAHFVVLVPGYLPESIQPTLELPATVHEVLSSVSQARSPAARDRFPLLAPAAPQPRLGSGVVLAFAEWQLQDNLICVDSSSLDGRIFAVSAPAYLTRHQLLALASVSERIGTLVFVGVDDVLAARFPWSGEPAFPAHDAGQVYCLVHDDCVMLFILDPRHPTAYRRQIAACVGIHETRLHLVPASRRVTDATLDGLYCRTVIAVYEGRPGDTRAPCLVIIDARALAAGWWSFRANGGQVSEAELLASVDVDAPAGWARKIAGVGDEAPFDVSPGQVFVVEVVRLPSRVPDRMQAPGDNPGSTSYAAQAPQSSASAPAGGLPTPPDEAAHSHDLPVPVDGPPSPAPTEADPSGSPEDGEEDAALEAVNVARAPLHRQTFPSGAVVVIDATRASGALFAIHQYIIVTCLGLCPLGGGCNCHTVTPLCWCRQTTPLSRPQILRPFCGRTPAGFLNGRGLFRGDIAARLGTPPHSLILHAPDPMIIDHEDRGVLSRNVIAAVTRPAAQGTGPAGPICFLDLRPMLLRLSWCHFAEGRLPLQTLLCRFSDRCPDGFVLCRIDPARGLSVIRGDIQVRHGEVVTLTFLSAEVDSSSSGGGPGGSGPSLPSGPTSEAADAASLDTSVTTSTGADAGLSTLPSAFAAECTALIPALWILPTAFWGYTIEVLSDCQAALAIANGSHACSTHIGQALRHVASVAFSLLSGRLSVAYVRGHAGIFGNEAADQVAKLVAEGRTLGYLPWPSWSDFDCWSSGGKMWSWIGVVCQWLAGDSALPDFLGGELCNGRDVIPGSLAKAHEVTLSEEQFLVLHRDARILVALCQCGFSVVFAVLHAPHRTTEHHLLEQWWGQAAGVLRKLVKGRPLIIAGDFNASVGTQVSCHVSDLAAEEQDLAGEALHRILRDHELWIPATFEGVHQGSSWTFAQKRNQALIRPDMIALPLAWRQAKVASWTDPGVTAAHGVVDHVAAIVSVRMQICCSKLAPRCKPPGRVPVPRPEWGDCNHSHAASVTGFLQSELRLPASGAVAPRSDRTRVSTSFSLPFRALRDGRGDALHDMLEGPWTLTARVAGTVSGLQLRVLGRRLKTQCKNDRARYVEGLADAVQCNRPGADAALQRLLCRRRRRAFAPAVLPEVLDDGGKPCDTPHLVQRRWREHFSAMENGVDVSAQDLSALATAARAVLPMPAHIHDLPCLADLCQAFASTQVGKAGGPDGLPSALNAAFPRQLAHIWYPVLLKFCLLGEEPLGFKGGVLTHLYKGRGSVSSCDSHRGILLLSVIAKALHRALRPAISRHFEAVAHPLQLGGRRGASVVFGSHIVRSFLRHRNAAKLSTVIVFSDVAAAYYRTERALTASGPHSQPAAAPPASTELDLEFQLVQPAALAQQGASEWLQAVTHEIHANTWMTLARDDQIIQTRRGTRPGSAWADLAFAVLAQRILSVRDAQRSPATVEAANSRILWDGARHWGESAALPAEHTETKLADVIWADDFAVCLGPPSALRVRPVLANEAGALVDAFGSHGFELSFGERKTAALVSLRGADARRVKRELFRGDATVPVLCEGRGHAKLPLVPAYRHLGVTIDPSGNIAVELCSIPADYAMRVQLPPAVLFWLQRPPVEMARARNEASAKDIKKVLKGNGFADAPKPDQYMNLSLDEVVAEYKVLILDVLKETSRPTVKVLLAGCMSLFPESSRELCKPWCEKLVNAVCHCRSKRSCTSGKKLPPAVREVVMFLKGMGGSVAREVSRSSFSSSASKPAASPRPSPSSVAPATRSSKEQIFTQYGLEAPVSDPGAEVEETGLSPAHVQEVFSSQEVMSPTQEAPPTAALPVEDKTSGGDGSAEYQEYFDSARLCMVRAYPSGALVMATMQKGEDGFQKALFPGSAEAVSTEIPNLRIQRMKRPAARVMKKPAAKKRPAAAPTTASASASSASLEENEDSGMEPQPSVAEEQPENVAAAQQDRVGRRTYTIMYYKAPRHKKAIRQKQAPFSQLFQFGRKGVPVWQMDRIAKACVQKLESGELEEADAEDWCKSRLAQPVAMATTGTSYYSGGGSGGGGWGSGGWGSGGWGGGGGRDDKSYWEPWKDDEPDEDPDDEPEYDLRYCQFCKSYGYIRKDGCVNKKCKPDYTPKEFDDIHGIGQAMACSLALGLSYVKTKAAGCPKGKWWGETEAAVDPEKRRRQAEAAEARSQAAAPASPTGPVAPAAGNDQGEPHAGDNQEKEKGEKGGDPADKLLGDRALPWRLEKMRPSAVPCGTDEEEVPRRTKSAAGEPVKTEPLSPQKPKETLGMAKAEVAGLLTSLKYQIKAKKMTEKHREQANDILLKYQQSGVHGKKEILQKLQTSGLRDLSWFAEMQSEYQTQSVDKESTTKGYFNRSQILKMNGLDPSNMDEAVAADTLKDLIADCEAEFGFKSDCKPHKNPLLAKYYYKQKVETEDTAATNSLGWSSCANVEGSDLGRLVEKFDNPDLEVPANEEAWNKAYSACKAAKSKLGKVADELEEQHAKLVAHGPQAEADEVGPKIETLRGFLKTLRFKISEWMNMSEGCMEAKLPELTQLSEEATSHLAAATAYNKKLKSQNCSLGVASLCCRAFRFRWARILGWHSYEGCAKGVKDLAQAKQGSNTARNLLRRNLRRTPWPPPYECQVRGKNPRTGKEDLYTLAFMLPHEVLHVLLESNDVSEIRNQQARIPNLQEQLQEHGNDVLLLGLWLDGVPFRSDRSQTLQCATLSLPGLTDAGDFRFPLTGFPKFFQMPEATWDDVTAIIAWSMRCCYTGFFPSFRHDESRFLGNDSWRKRRASQPLGCRAVLAEVRADWSAYQEVLRLPGWTGNGPICWFCQATLQDLHDVDESSSWRSSRLSHYQFLARQISEGKNLSPLFSGPCFSVQKCCIDWLHCMDLGCAADYMGGLFHMVVQTKLPERSVHDRCKNLFGDIQNYYRRNLSQSRMSTLTPLMLKGKNKKWPKLRAKAGEARDLIGFAKECAERHMGNSDFERTVRQTAKHLHSCYEFLSERHWDAEKFHKTVNKFAALFVELSKFPGQTYFRTKPKMHLLLELGRQKRRPSETWTYRDEGFGHVLSLHAKRRGGKYSMKGTSKQMLSKFCVNNRRGALLRTFVLSRLTFGAGAWPPLRVCESRVFSRTLFALYRATLAVPKDGDQHLSTAEVCSLVGQPDADTVLHVERLTYLRQLVAGAPSELWALVRLDLPYLRALQASMAWLYSWVHRTTDLPCPNAEPEPWTSLMRQAPGRFKGLVRRARGLAILRTSGYAALRALLRGLHALEGASIAPSANCGEVFTEACLVCGMAFTSRSAWACHASKKHGYRLVTSQMAGTHDRLCLGCGKCFAKPARLRRHLLSSVPCRKAWGSFRPDSASLPAMHALALPLRVPGVMSGGHAEIDPATYHKGLLETLQALDCADCDTAWGVIKDFIEPLSVLRATVDLWASPPGAAPGVAEVAEDVKLMLDPQLCCDDFRASRANGGSVDVFEALDWRPTCQLPFVLTGEVAAFSIDDPPLQGYAYPFTCSLPLAAASGFMRWLETSCDILGTFAQTSAAHPVRLRASAAALAALEPAGAWLLRAGFVQTASGLRSPGS